MIILITANKQIIYFNDYLNRRGGNANEKNNKRTKGKAKDPTGFLTNFTYQNKLSLSFAEKRSFRLMIMLKIRACVLYGIFLIPLFCAGVNFLKTEFYLAKNLDYHFEFKPVYISVPTSIILLIYDGTKFFLSFHLQSKGTIKSKTFSLFLTITVIELSNYLFQFVPIPETCGKLIEPCKKVLRSILHFGSNYMFISILYSMFLFGTVSYTRSIIALSVLSNIIFLMSHFLNSSIKYVYEYWGQYEVKHPTFKTIIFKIAVFLISPTTILLRIRTYLLMKKNYDTYWNKRFRLFKIK